VAEPVQRTGRGRYRREGRAGVGRGLIVPVRAHFRHWWSYSCGESRIDSDGDVMGTLDGKVAFITGAGRGQGRSHAVRFAREGADIIAVDTTAEAKSVPYPLATAEDLAETARLVEGEGRRIFARDADVRDLAALTAAVDEGVKALGRLDIVVANAGISSPAPTLGMSEDTWQEMIDINLTGVWKTLKASVPHIVE